VKPTKICAKNAGANFDLARLVITTALAVEKTPPGMVLLRVLVLIVRGENSTSIKLLEAESMTRLCEE
jgi:hypothetical protein